MAILEQSWSTEHLQPGKALSYWRDVICENLLQMHIQSSQEREFFGHIEKHAFGPIKANFISVSEQKVWRAVRLRRHDLQRGIVCLPAP